MYGYRACGWHIIIYVKRPLCLVLIDLLLLFDALLLDRCISMNAAFIMKMLEVWPFETVISWYLQCTCFVENCNAHDGIIKNEKLQAFEPPFDMSQYVNAGGYDHPPNMHDHSHVDCTHSSGRGDCSTISVSRSNSQLDGQHGNPKEDAKTHESSRETENKKARPVLILLLYIDGCFRAQVTFR